MAAMIPWVRMTFETTLEPRQCCISTDVSQTACTGQHWKIHIKVRTRFEIIRITMLAYKGMICFFFIGMRSKKKAMETLVHIRVKKVWIPCRCELCAFIFSVKRRPGPTYIPRS